MGYYSDKEIIQGIKKRELKIYEYLYERFNKQIIQHVRNNDSMNPIEDGNDLYQDTIVEIIRIVKEERYKEEWIFGGTFEKIYERKWLKILAERKKKPLSDIKKIQNHIIEDTTYNELSDIYDYIKKMSKECQEIFNYQNHNLKKNAVKLNTKPATIRKRKSRCVQKLRELMERDGFI
ncbi:MAG: RNA polymerase sigma factor [Chitinophagales bacterium]